MQAPAPESLVMRFAVFEADLQAGELRKNGVRIKLAGQPFEVLALLLQHPGQVMTREALKQKLWPADTFVDFDNSLNAAINKLREALADSADAPRFVETLPRRGYRFIYPVEILEHAPRTQKPPTKAKLYIAAAMLALALVATLVLGFNLKGLRDRLLGKPAPGEITSIAVLPLRNLSGDPEQDYFTDGMTDALITEVGQISALRVISRQSVMQFKETNKPLPEIARELNVDALVEGAVVRDGDRVRVTTNLIQVSPERHLWAQSYERDLHDILALQSRMAREIAQQIRISVTPEERSRLGSTSSVDPEAYELHLKGLYYFVRRTTPGETLWRSREYFEQAIAKDPAFARAYAGLANVYAAAAYRRLMPTAEGYERARVAAKKALELDESLGEAHMALAGVMGYDWDWAGAEREHKRAIELTPNFADAHNWYAQYLTGMGRHDEAIAEAKRAIELDPLSMHLRYMVAEAFFFARRYDEAIEQAKKIIDLDPNWEGIPTVYYRLANSYLLKGMHEEAFRSFEKGETLTGGSPEYLTKLRKAYKEGGMEGVLRYWLQFDWLAGMTRASVHAYLGEKDRAFELLDKLAREKAPGLLHLKVDQGLDSLRSDPRYYDLLRRMGLPP